MADEFTRARIQNLIEQYIETRGRRYDYVSVCAARTAISVRPSTSPSLGVHLLVVHAGAVRERRQSPI